MTRITRRGILQTLAATPFMAPAIVRSAVTAALFQKSHADASTPTDWSKALCDSNMLRTPDPTKLGGWGYAISLYLYGQFLVYKRTGEKKYLDYIQGWVDKHVSDDGVIDRPISALDYMLPGNLLLVLYTETRQEKYRKAADSIRHRFDIYPRTEDGGFWHALSRQHQLWLDGMFMSMPFLVRYGKAFHDEAYTNDEAAKQLLIYIKHLNDPATGLMWHAYDESGAQAWADPVTHHSAILWCRAIGWFGMALIEVLEVIPHNHPHRKELIAQVVQLAHAYANYQDPATGLWYQVVDKGATAGNWLETSSSSMYTYTIYMAVQRGYIPKKMLDVACKGYQGVLTQLSIDSDGQAHIANICGGTNVGDLNYYFNRPRNTDDFHGLGAFLIMNETLRASPVALHHASDSQAFTNERECFMNGQRKLKSAPVGVVGKVLRILEVLDRAPQGLPLKDIADVTALNKSTAHRFVAHLEGAGYLFRDESKAYMIGPKLVRLGTRTTYQTTLCRLSRLVLNRLWKLTGETVNLAVLDGREVFYVDVLESLHTFRLVSQVGTRRPLHSTALGKAILSRMDTTALEEALRGIRFEHSTPRTISSVPQLRKDLALCATRGFALDDEEVVTGARCIGAAIVDANGKVAAGISVSGPVVRLSSDKVPHFARALRLAADEISRKLGYDGEPLPELHRTSSPARLQARSATLRPAPPLAGQRQPSGRMT